MREMQLHHQQAQLREILRVDVALNELEHVDWNAKADPSWLNDFGELIDQVVAVAKCVQTHCLIRSAVLIQFAMVILRQQAEAESQRF